MQGAKLSERLHRYCCCAAAPACAPAITLSLSWTSASSPSGRKNCRYIEYWLTMSGMRRSPPAFDGRVLPNTPPADQGCTSHRPMSAREPLVSRDSCHVWRAAARSSGWHWKSSKKSCSWITASLPGALACLIEVPTGVASAHAALQSELPWETSSTPLSSSGWLTQRPAEGLSFLGVSLGAHGSPVSLGSRRAKPSSLNDR
jgi:hypothetical protein